MTPKQRRIVLITVVCLAVGVLIGWGVNRVQYAAAHPRPVTVTDMQASIGDHCYLGPNFALEAQPVATHPWTDGSGKTTYVFQADPSPADGGGVNAHLYVTTQHNRIYFVDCGDLRAPGDPLNP